MGEEVNTSEYEEKLGDDDRVTEWEMGLPTGDDLTPLSYPLIPPELASAFSISPEPHRSLLDVNQASQTTLSNLRSNALPLNNFKAFADGRDPDPTAAETDNSGLEMRIDPEEADSGTRVATEDPAARALKRPRLVWTPQLHKRFVDVVGHLGIKNAVPKTIMQLMNVEGLTRENVASHLQKYRLYLKRMQGIPADEPASPDPTFVPENNGGGGEGSGSAAGHGNGHLGWPPQPMMPMPVYGHMGMQMGNHHQQQHPNHNHHQHPQHYHPHYHNNNNGFDGNVQYNFNVLQQQQQQQQRDWSGNNYGSVGSYPQHHSYHVAPSGNM